MPTIEDMLQEISENRANLEAVCERNDDGIYRLAARIRFWGKDLKGQMVIAEGDTWYDAVDKALNLARAGRTRTLDFAYRPWRTPGSTRGWTAVP